MRQDPTVGDPKRSRKTHFALCTRNSNYETLSVKTYQEILGLDNSQEQLLVKNDFIQIFKQNETCQNA